jgi:hypothetical protein
MTIAERITKKAAEFRSWLSGCGAQVLEPTNEWELIRFKAGNDTCVIYRNKAGRVTFSGVSEAAWKAFTNSTAWRAAPATKRRKVSPHITALRKRDGNLCFFCQRYVDEEHESVEHLVSVTHGGPNHISNLFLAHKGCNAKAGHLSAPEKITIHVNAVIASEEESRRDP